MFSLMASKLTIFTANHSIRTNTILISIKLTIFSSTTPSEQVQTITYTIFSQPLQSNVNHSKEQIQYCFHYLYHTQPLHHILNSKLTIFNHSNRTNTILIFHIQLNPIPYSAPTLPFRTSTNHVPVLIADKLTIFTVNHSNKTNTMQFPLPIPYSAQPLHQNKYKPCSVLMASKLTIFTVNHSNRTNTILISITYTIFTSTTPSEQVQTMFSLNGQ
ncbi:unnamed protein product [Mytilus edulis]|uniref:Uncharacterized protein n=1 Tax=Mytilus edulis TaxID=6550 RepID=A0A8S3QSI6_MYTED|nr:unnamed protein product [Mytilus edulis]